MSAQIDVLQKNRKPLPTTAEKCLIAEQLQMLLDVHHWHQTRDPRLDFLKRDRAKVIKAYQLVISDLKSQVPLTD